MKDKTKKALKSLLDDVTDQDDETYSVVMVDKADLKRLLRWAQDKSHHYFEGDRVKRTGASVPFAWLDMGMEGTVTEDTNDKGITQVEWDNAPEGHNRYTMYHNEIVRVK